MRSQLAACALIAGCGYPPLPRAGAIPDGAIDDAAVDGAAMATECFQKWLDHTVDISDSTVQEITELSSAGNDRNPWISPDGLRMYFSRDNGTSASSDIYVASRAMKTLPFELPLPLAPVNSIAREGRAWPTPDESMLALSTERNGMLDIDISTRQLAVFLTPSPSHLAMVNATGKLRADPFLSADRKRLYLTIH